MIINQLDLKPKITVTSISVHDYIKTDRCESEYMNNETKNVVAVERIKTEESKNKTDIKENKVKAESKIIVNLLNIFPETDAASNSESNNEDRNDKKNMVFCCNTCSYQTTSIENLNGYMSSHTDTQIDSSEFKDKCDSEIKLKCHPENQFSCKVCDYECADLNILKTHSKTHTRKEDHKCNEANNKYADDKSKQQKESMHTNHKTNFINNKAAYTVKNSLFKCTMCNYKTIQKCNLTRHLRIHTKKTWNNPKDKNDEQKESTSLNCKLKKLEMTSSFNLQAVETVFHKCTMCDYKTHVKGNLVQHTRKHSRDITTQLKDKKSSKKYSCNNCNYVTDYKCNWQRHVTTHTKEKLSCSACQFKCNHVYTLMKHAKIHIDRTESKLGKEKLTNTYACDYCDFKTNCKLTLTKHWVLHSKDLSFKCKDCNFESAHKNSLKRHMKLHINDTESFACNDCNYKSNQKCILIRHIRSHHETYPIKCDQCDFQTTHAGRYKNHKKTHAKIKFQHCFECNECFYKTNQKSNLVRHMRRHMKLYNLFCDLCDYKCYDAKYLDEHTRKHHTRENPLVCHVCGYNCYNRGSFYIHTRAHFKELQFTCHICAYKTSYKSNLNKHLRSHDKGAVCRGRPAIWRKLLEDE